MSKQIMNARIISLILNIVLDYLAIRLNYGVSGVAWATVIIETIYMIRLVNLSKDTVIYKIDKECLKDLLKLAKHGIVDRIFDRGGKLVLDIILSRLGTYEYAAHVILNQIENFANDFCYGFGIGITTNIGIKLGENNKKEIEDVKNVINKITRILTIIIPIIIFMVLLISLPMLLKEQETLMIAYKLIPLVVIYSALMPIKYKYTSIITGMKELKYNAQVSISTNTIKILLSYILCKYIGISGAWLTFSISCIIIIIALKRKIKTLV
jgi:Na+-driven multidrug efflux pump